MTVHRCFVVTILKPHMRFTDTVRIGCNFVRVDLIAIHAQSNSDGLASELIASSSTCQCKFDNDASISVCVSMVLRWFSSITYMYPNTIDEAIARMCPQMRCRLCHTDVYHDGDDYLDVEIVYASVTSVAHMLHLYCHI